MNLIRLTLQAIGPYAGEHTVDFAALGQSGLFLLDGPTGSGKSTIIDALVFALYGTQAGAAASPDRLHSHHAARGVEPFVEVVFETGAGIHRIRRTPAWWRPKSRGDGVTRANASATLVRLASPDAVAGEVVSTSTQEVGGEIARILGLTREQFVQTVVLPQGEFAKFLASSGEDRRLVLQSLFGTAIYERTTAALVEMRKAAHALVVGAEQAVSQALVRLREASGEPELEVDGVPDVLFGLASEASITSTAESTAREAAAVARKSLETETRVQRALARRVALTADRALLDEAADTDAADRRRLEAARRAEGVVATVHAERLSASRLAVAAQARDEALAAFPHADGATTDELRERRDHVVARAQTLSELAGLEAGLPGREAAAEADEQAVTDLDAAIAAANETLAARPADRLPLVAAVTTAEAAGRDVTTARDAVAAARNRVVEVVQLADLESVVVSAVAARDAAASRARAAVAHEADLRARRIDGMAGELALALVPGEPCAVCGSREHPAVARVTDAHPTVEMIDAAADLRAAAEAELSAASEVATSARERCDAARAALDGLDAGAADSAVRAAEAALAAATASGAALAQATDALTRFDAETEAVRSRLAGMRESRATLVSRLVEVRAGLRADRERMAAAVEADGAGRDPATVLDLLRRVEAEAESLGAVIAALDRVAAATSDHGERADALASALSSAEFAAVADVEAALLEFAETRTLEARLAENDRRRAVVDEGLRDADVASITGDEEVDVEAASSRAEAVELALEVATVASVRAADLLRKTQEAVDSFDAAQRAKLDVAEEARATVRMADVASASDAQNTTGITLGTYVLLRRFDDVLAAANTRLATMSSGRYRLESSDTRESGSRARKTGLALVIRDQTTDTTRDPKSFSGGETFYASLSLALGLADVVQAESGGIDLGTLFVDEGFGTLDPETLDAVMTELGRLSAHGRVVGIVSHVDELKQRIADRIEVRRLPDGSSTLRSTAG